MGRPSSSEVSQLVERARDGADPTRTLLILALGQFLAVTGGFVRAGHSAPVMTDVFDNAVAALRFAGGDENSAADDAEPDIAAICTTCGDQVGAAITRAMKSARDKTGMAQVALSGAVSGMGMAAGAFCARIDAMGADHADPMAVADELWSIVRPMIVRSVADVRAEREGATA